LSISRGLKLHRRDAEYAEVSQRVEQFKNVKLKPNEHLCYIRFDTIKGETF